MQYTKQNYPKTALIKSNQICQTTGSPFKRQTKQHQHNIYLDLDELEVLFISQIIYELVSFFLNDKTKPSALPIYTSWLIKY